MSIERVTILVTSLTHRHEDVKYMQICAYVCFDMNTKGNVYLMPKQNKDQSNLC